MNRNTSVIIIALSGLFLVGYSLFIYLISPHFTYVADPSKENIVSYILVRIVIGIIYIFSVIVFIKKIRPSKNIIIFIFSIGIISRIILVFSEPILEDDFNRYLWDGAVTVNGFNPYKYTPKDFFIDNNGKSDSLTTLHRLAKESDGVIKKINHPHIRTIYPPVAQFVFGLSYTIKPWSIPVWKGILVLIDIIVFILLIIILHKLNYPKVFSVIYWWNPVLIHEIFNAGHMDIIMYPLLLLGILFIIKNKNIASTVMIAFAVGVKIWPVAFLPVFYKKIVNNKKVLFISLFTSAIIVLLILLPILLTKLDDSLGFVTYSKNWTNNEAVFKIINFLVKEFIHIFDINYYCSLCASRWIVIIFIGLLITFFTLKPINDNKDLIYRLYLIVALIYFISPTQFPWYYTWILPFSVINPRLSIIIYAVTLPLYQLKYHFPYLVWIEHIPIFILFIFEVFNRSVGNFLKPLELLNKKITSENLKV